MKVLVACEESQEVCKAFRAKGHEAYSCDLQECSGEHPEWHIKDDIFHYLCSSMRIYHFDFMGGHPDCTYLTNAGIGWLVRKNPKDGFEWDAAIKRYVNRDRWLKMESACAFFKSLFSFVKSAGKGYLENPIMHKYAMEIIGIKPTQVIQPYQFGHPESKATCLWVVGLPPLQETNNVKHIWKSLPKNQAQKMHYMPPGKERAKMRSKTYPGIAKAMADQWG